MYMDAQDIVLALSLTTNAGQIVRDFIRSRSEAKKDKALVKQEEVNSVEGAERIYDKLTTRLDKELEKLTRKSDTLEQTVEKQAVEIQSLRKELKQYKEKCIHCTNNQSTS